MAQGARAKNATDEPLINRGQRRRRKRYWLGDASAIKDQLAASGLRLVPQPYRPYGDIWLLLGVLTSAALLSLGAPFWFNALKTASTLRPAIAAAVQTRDDADRAR